MTRPSVDRTSTDQSAGQSGSLVDGVSIRFVLDGEVIELDSVEPTRTVLQFLREDLRRTGTKEGCAEGDCGACTVVLAELNRDGDDLIVRAINSCIQFLPTLDGKELITVESLTTPPADLHPVQQAMVDCHGSQCGFCTPGFVMSLFALYKNQASPNRREIDDALAGNLCRCTGYRPIIEAARAMYDGNTGHSDEDDWLRQPFGAQTVPTDRVRRLNELGRSGGSVFRAEERAFHAPASVDELAEILASVPDATLLAGGTDVGLWVTKQHRELKDIVYIGSVAELCDVRVTDTHIEIGSAVSLSDAMAPIVEAYPGLGEMFQRFASPPIRNAGTLGGNIANGSPIGDSMPALIAAGATLRLRSVSDGREVPLDEFYVDYGVKNLKPREFIETIRVPLPADTMDIRCYKLSKRFDQDISAVCAAFRLELADGEVASIRVACGGMAATVKRAMHCEAALMGQPWNTRTVENGMDALARDFQPISDMRASADYRMRACRNLLQRFYLETTGALQDSVYGYGR